MFRSGLVEGQASGNNEHYNRSITQIYFNNTVNTNITATMPAPSDRGQCFFYGGQDVATSMWQTIDLSDDVDPVLIDNHTVYCNLSAWLGGMSGQDDDTVILLTFADQFNQTIGSGVSIVCKLSRSSKNSS